jgi:competence protein ComEC
MYKRCVTLVIILLLLPAFVSADMSVTFIDVGQGDAELINADGEFMLIDAGPQENDAAVLDCLQENGVETISLLVGTHPHEDHIGGMADVLNQYDVEEIMMPRVMSEIKAFEDLLLAVQSKNMSITSPVPGTIYAVGNAMVTVIAPAGDDYSLNNFSIVLRVDYGETSFLFTGDIEEDAEDDILDTGADIDVDVLKVAHHGSRTSTNLSFLSATSPKIAVISCGKDNPYGQPEDLILFRLTRTGVDVYRTDQDGDITLTTDGKTITLETEDGDYEVYN